MAEKLLFCADNLFCDLIYPAHTIVADQERAGFEAYHVADGRREFFDRWEPTTANADHWVKATFDQLRAFDFCAIDRASTAKGYRQVLEDSADDFVSPPYSLFDITLPTAPGGAPGTGLGVVTQEGAWLKTFPVDASYAVRLTSKAMGAGLVPQLTGLWVGKAWQPTNFLLDYPANDEKYRIDYTESKSVRGWVGRSRYVKTRVGQLTIKPQDEADYDMIEWQVLGLYARGFPAWIIHDRIDGGRRAFLAYCPAGDLDWSQTVDWPTRGLTIPFVEEQPL